MALGCQAESPERVLRICAEHPYRRRQASRSAAVNSVSVSDNPSSSPALALYPRTDQEFSDRFATEDACSAYLERLRWGKQFCCPKCESPKGWRNCDWALGLRRMRSQSIGDFGHSLRSHADSPSELVYCSLV